MQVERLSLVVGIMLAGCQHNPTKQDIERLVDQHLDARGVHAPEAASAAVTAAKPQAPKDIAAETIAFLAHLEDLMRDFQPNIAPVEDASDAFRCITSDALVSNPELAKAKAALTGKIEAARREREQKVREFYAETYPVSFRIDYDWTTRKTEPVAPIFDCFNATAGRWTRGLNAESCALNPYTGFVTFEWKPRIPGKPAHFLYSGGDSPPTTPPELMQRIDASKTQIPGRLGCRVSNVVIEKTGKIVSCESANTPFAIRTGNELPALNVGDLITAPLAGVHRDPDGVLSRRQRGKTYTWILDADAKSISIETKAQCPSVDEVIAALKP